MNDQAYPNRFRVLDQVAMTHTAASADKPSLFSFILIAVYLIGFPVIFAANRLYQLELDDRLPFAMTAASGLVFLFSFSKVKITKTHRLFYQYFAVLVFTLLLAFLGTNPYISNGEIALLFSYFAYASGFIGMYYLVRTRLHYQFAMLLLDILGIALPISVFMSYIAPTFLNFSFGEVVTSPVLRAFGPFGDQVGFTLTYFLFRALIRRRWADFALNAGAILLTGTRGAWLAAGLGILWMMISIPNLTKRQQQSVTIVFLAACLVGGGVLFLTDSDDAGTASYVELRFSDEASYAQRSSSFQLGLQVFGQSPFVGVGFMGFRLFRQELNFDQYFASDISTARSTVTAQNQYIQTATEGGVLALGALMLFIVSLFTTIRDAVKQTKGIYYKSVFAYFIWLISMLIGNLASVWLLPNNITTYIFYLITGLELSLAQGQFRTTDDSAT